MSFDVIVVGSGSAGAVVARRLVDAGARRRAARGGRRRLNPAIHDPARALRALGQRAGLGLPDRAAAACARPRAALAARQGARRLERAQRDDLVPRPPQRLRPLGVPRQRGLGLRRRAAAVPALGGLRPRRVATTTGRAARCTCCRATSRIRSAPRSSPPPQEAGIPFNDDHNGASLDGVGVRASSTSRTACGTSTAAALPGSRCSTRADLTVLTGRARAAARCSRAALRRRRGRARRRASRASAPSGEVVVCAGTIESPKLLLLSGIGPADELAPLGIDVVVDLPGVGSNLHDHVLSPVIYSASRADAAGARPGCSRCTGPPLLAQPPGPARARHPAALLPPAALPRGDGGPGRRLHAHGRARSAPPAAARCASPRPTRRRRR